MNISHEWLDQFVPHGLSAEAVRDLLTAHVATVEGLEHLRSDLESFVVARVIESERIPETKLSFNKVDDGSGTLREVVCGAPNVMVGATYPFARTGTIMPGGMVIEKRKIRGFTSNGMLCSAKELGLGDDHDGIMALETDAVPGTALLKVLPLGDVRLVVDVLPNRPDLLSHIGVAREVAALTGTVLRTPPELVSMSTPVVAPVTGSSEVSAHGLTVRIEDADGCPLYGAAVIDSVTVGASPDWLRARIEAVGGRSINNVVDATNYLLHGYGQPMHAFDATALGGDTIVIRRARAGEVIETLDAVKRKLDPSMLLIADATQPIALAGVMGGRASEVTPATTRVVLEVAEFSRALVRSTRRKAGLSTDASYRFERGIDPAAVSQLLALGAALIAEVSGGRVTGLIQAGSPVVDRASVTLRPARVERLLGVAVPTREISSLLRSVGFAISDAEDGGLSVTPPSWRHDVEREVDLIEEVARLRGFDSLPDALQGARPGTVPDDALYTASRRVRDALVADGLFEVRPLPFTAGADEGFVRVRNPLAEDEPFLRRSVLDTLARRAEYNLNRMQGNVRLFEVGAVFAPVEGALPREEQRVGALIMGSRRPSHFSEPQPPAFDAWDAKAVALRVASTAYPGSEVALKPGLAPTLWTIEVDGAEIGEVRPVVLDAPVWAKEAFGVELSLGLVANAPPAPRGSHVHAAPTTPVPRVPVRYRALPTTPAAEFDLALLVPDSIPASDVERVLRETSGSQLERCELFDEFRGAGVESGARSLAWRLTFRHPERTLRDKELDARRSQLLKTLEASLGVRPRTA